MPRINEMWAFIAEDSGPEDEGVIAMLGPKNLMIPLVGSDLTRVESLRPHAMEIAKRLGKPVKLVHFTTRVEVETL